MKISLNLLAIALFAALPSLSSPLPTTTRSKFAAPATLSSSSPIATPTTTAPDSGPAGSAHDHANIEAAAVGPAYGPAWPFGGQVYRGNTMAARHLITPSALAAHHLPVFTAYARAEVAPATITATPSAMPDAVKLAGLTEITDFEAFVHAPNFKKGLGSSEAAEPVPDAWSDFLGIAGRLTKALSQSSKTMGGMGGMFGYRH